jgi:hypothetical protein
MKRCIRQVRSWLAVYVALYCCSACMRPLPCCVICMLRVAVLFWLLCAPEWCTACACLHAMHGLPATVSHLAIV